MYKNVENRPFMFNFERALRMEVDWTFDVPYARKIKFRIQAILWIAELETYSSYGKAG